MIHPGQRKRQGEPMKRRGLVGGGWCRIAAASSSLFVPLALAPATSALPLPVAAAGPGTTSAQSAASATSAQPELVTYAGAPAAGKPTEVAQQPFGLAVSGRYTFVADPVNHLVRLLIDNSELVFAGNGSLASEGDGKDLALSQLVCPYAVAVGPFSQQGFQVTAFDVYIADTFAHKIKKIKVAVPRINNATDVQTVDISTLAGSGDFGFAGDGNRGADLLKAQFNSPYGLAWDDSRQILYVADTLNNRIRAIHDPVQPTAEPRGPVPAPLPADRQTGL